MADHKFRGRQSPTDYEQRVIDAVAKHGWFCVSVVGNHPGFSYSVGFEETLGAPECIVFGLESKLMHAMLWSLFRQLEDGQSTLSDGHRWSGLIEGFDCVSRPVHPTWLTREHFNTAMWYWGDPQRMGRGIRAYQVFWPDAVEGLFPWETGCAQSVQDPQPPLYLPRSSWKPPPVPGADT